jgi:hypothetical protein
MTHERTYFCTVDAEDDSTAEEVDAASKKSVSFRPPGR